MPTARRAVSDGPRRAGHREGASRRALEPPRLRLLRQFTAIPDGMKFLVNLRAFLLPAPRKTTRCSRRSEADLRTLLASWFDVGFLELQRIDWSSPAALLEKLVGYEAVHENPLRGAT